MKQERTKGSRRDRLGYAWMYYKIPVILSAALLLIAISFLREAFLTPPSQLNVMLLDAGSRREDEAWQEDFMRAADLDQTRASVRISTTQLLDGRGAADYQMYSLARLYADIGTGDLDVCAMRESDFENYAGAGTFLDLREVFDEETLDGFPGLWRDGTGRVLGMDCRALPGLAGCQGYTDPDDPGVIGIVYNAGHPDMAKRFILYLKQEEREGDVK